MFYVINVLLFQFPTFHFHFKLFSSFCYARLNWPTACSVSFRAKIHIVLYCRTCRIKWSLRRTRDPVEATGSDALQVCVQMDADAECRHSPTRLGAVACNGHIISYCIHSGVQFVGWKSTHTSRRAWIRQSNNISESWQRPQHRHRHILLLALITASDRPLILVIVVPVEVKKKRRPNVLPEP